METNESVKRLAPTKETLIRLYAKSGNQCAFPSCKHRIFDKEGDLIAQVCHIEAASEGGERFNEGQSNEERRQYENLIIFCYEHHVKTNDVNVYSVEKLNEIKNKHEAKFEEREVNDEEIQKLYEFGLKKIEQLLLKVNNKIENINHDLKKLTTFVTSDIPLEISEDIEDILEYRKDNKQLVTINSLEKLKTRKWSKLNAEQKYRILANIGICYLDLDKGEKAAEFLTKAVEYSKDNAKALGLASLGFAVIGKKDEAERLARVAIEKDDSISSAYVSLIMANSSLVIDELLELIPTNKQSETDIAFALAKLCSSKNDLENSIKWYQIAVDNAKPDRVFDVKAGLAITILKSVETPYNIYSRELDVEAKNKINYCIGLLSEAWDEVSNTDLKTSRIIYLINRSVAKKYINDIRGAFDDLKLIESFSENDIELILRLAISAFENGENTKAYEYIQKIENTKREELTPFGKDTFILLKARILLKLDEREEAEKILREALKNNTLKKRRTEARSLLINEFLNSGRKEEAREVSKQILEEEPNNIIALIDAVKIDEEKAGEYLRDAEKAVDKQTEYIDIYILAQVLYNYGEYELTINCIEKTEEQYLGLKLLKILIDSYFKLGNDKKAIELSKAIEEKNGPIESITEIQAYIYENIGNVTGAIECCKKHLEVYPDTVPIKIRLALLCYRIQELEAVKDILEFKEDIINSDINPIELFKVANLLIKIGDVKGGLDLAYKIRKKHFSEGIAHQYYVDIIFSNRELDIEPHLANVIVDSSVKLINGIGEESAYTVVNDKNTKESEINVSEALAQKLLNKEVGDEIVIERIFGDSEVFKITAILNKYTFAFQESLKLLENKFIDIKSFKSFKLGETGNIKDDLKPIFDELDAFENAQNELNEFYQNNPVPISILCKHQSHNMVKGWMQTISNPKRGIFCNALYLNNTPNAKQLIKEGKGIVVDIISLLTLNSLGYLEVFNKIKNKKYVTQTLIDELNFFLLELENDAHTDTLSVTKINGEYVKHITPREQTEKAIVYYQNLLTWTKNNCEVLYSKELLNINREEREEKYKMLGNVVVDTIYLAKEKSLLLLADEDAIRSFAFGEYGVKSFGVHTLFEFLQESSVIKKEEYTEINRQLISQYCYKYLPVSGEDLYFFLDKSEFKIDFPFSFALENFSPKVSQWQAVVNVSIDFFYALYINTNLPQVRVNPVIIVLQKLRTYPNFLQVLSNLKIGIKSRFRFLPFHQEHLLAVISDFESTV